MPTLLTLSYASVNEPHRAPYDRLARAHGWTVHVVAPSQVVVQAAAPKVCDAPAIDARYTLHPVPVRFGRNGRLTWFGGLLPIVLRTKPDVVFIEHDPGSIAVLQAAIVAPRARRFPFSVENIDRDRFGEALRAARMGQLGPASRDAVVGFLGEIGLRASHGVACISEDGRRIFEKRASKPAFVVPLGTDTLRFHPMNASELRAKLGLGDAFVFGYFGRIVPEKGVHLLVDVLARLPERFRLLLDMFKNFEPGSYAASILRRADELGVRNRIVTIDVPHQEVPRHMVVCDAIVLPSLSTERWKEQFGRVLPEAMACGVPVVGSSSGNIPHMIGDAGIVVPEGEVGAIADALAQLERSPTLRKRLQVAGRARVELLFSVEAQVERMRQLFESSGTGENRPRPGMAPR